MITYHVDSYRRFAEALSLADPDLSPLKPEQGFGAGALFISKRQRSTNLLSFDAERIAKLNNNVRRPFPTIIGGTVDDGSFNASAFGSGGQYFIGQNWGTILFVDALIMRLFCDPNFLSWMPISDTNREILLKNLVTWPASTFDETSASHLKTGDPNKDDLDLDSLTGGLYRFLAECVLGIILQHEQRHILGGHLDLIDRLYNMRSIVELHPSGFSSDVGLTLQAIERDADEAALGSCFTNFYFIHRKKHPGQAQLPRSLERMTDLRQVTELTFVCFEIMYRIFSLSDDDGMLDWDSLGHPPNSVRRSLVLDSLSFLATTPSLGPDIGPEAISLDDANSLFGRVAITVDKAFRKAMNLNPSLTTQPSLNQIESHKLKIWEKSYEIQTDLNKFRYADFGFDKYRSAGQKFPK